jgi:uncharacterized lipoprotein NlpE involved in copper resistance
MNKKRIFMGMLVCALALSFTLAGCDDGTGPGSDPTWPAEITYKPGDRPGFSIGGWVKEETTIYFDTNDEGTSFVRSCKLVGVNGTTYSIQALVYLEFTGDIYTFKATVSGDTLTIADASSGCPVANGAYTKVTD